MSDSEQMQMQFQQSTHVNGVQPPPVTFGAPDANQPVPVSERPTELHTRPRPKGVDDLKAFIRRLSGEVKQSKTAVSLSFITGLIIGLTILGWYVWPVQWTDAGLSHLTQRHKVMVVEMAADLNAYDPTTGRITIVGRDWYEMSNYACAMAQAEADAAQRARLVSLAWRLNGYGCQ